MTSGPRPGFQSSSIAHVHLYAKAVPHAVVRTLEDRDHQLDNDLSDVARDIRSPG
ncbi:hypothetical protein [Rhizobium leguminosarum]|uniref:hypothetical protein n=1 Tax=Rhizobium leguminosarum TaxID=384 RepID=UPI0021BBC12B|nr:hypothetical protein [Rhizobium leguminosarum]